MKVKVIAEIDCINTGAVNYAFGELFACLSKQKIVDWKIKVVNEE